MVRAMLVCAIASAMSLSACSDKKAAAAADLHGAQALYAKNDLAGALEAVDKAVRADPRNKDAHVLAGQVRASLGDLVPAITAFDRADRLDPNDKTARLKTIELLLGANALDAAASRINATLGDQPGNQDALAYRAVVEMRQEQREKARADAQKVLVPTPTHAVANAVVAEIALRDHHPDLALAAVDAGLGKHPDDPMLLRAQADALQMQNRPDEAIAIDRKLVTAAPANPLYRAVLAEAEAARVSVEAGETTLRAGVAAVPKSRPMRLQLVGYLGRHRGAPAAEAELRAAIAAAPDTSAYDLLLAANLAASGRSDQAADLLRAAVTRLGDNPARVEAQLGLARLSIGRNDTATASAVLDDILKAQPAETDALLLRAGLLLRRGEATRATADLLAVTGRQPTNAAAFDLLAKAFLQLGKADEAADALKRNADVKPNDLPATLKVVDLYASLGKVTEARAAIGRFVTRNPNGREGRAAEIRLLLAAKDWSAAQGKIDQLVRVPDSTALSTILTAEMKEARGQSAEAAALYKGLLSTEAPQRFDERAGRAFVRTALSAGQGTEAITFLDAFSSDQTGPKAAALHLLLGTLHAALGQDDKASDADQAAIRAAPTAVDGYVQKAAFLAQIKHVEEAVVTIDTGIAAGAPREPLLLAKAAIQTGAADPDAAIATYRAILAGNPSSVVAANNLASLLADRKPIDRGTLTLARDALVKLVRPDDAAIADTVAWADYRLGDFASAKTLLVQAGADHSTEAQVRFHYGAVLIASGEKDSGRNMIRTVLDRNFPGRPEAQELVDQ